MRYSFFSLTLALAASIVSAGFVSFALADSRTGRSVPCPEIIGDKREGIYYKKGTNSPKSKRYPFMCYSGESPAKKLGFETKSKALKQDFTGWYRVELKRAKDTCNPQFLRGGPVLFLQVRETPAGVFGSFCPTFGNYSGVRAGNGFIVSTMNDVVENSAGSICDDGKVQEHEYLEVDRVIDGAPAFNVRFKQVHTCASANSSGLSCSIEYTGVAFFESHKIWQDVGVSNNLSNFGSGCSKALQKCASCHPELNGL